METRELDRATIAVANTTGISGTTIANEVNRSLRTRKGRSLGRIICSILRGPLMAAGLFVALAPMPVRADNDKDIHRGREDNDKGIRAEIMAVQAQVTSLQSTISALQSQVTTVQTANASLKDEFNSLQASNAALQSKVNGLQTSNDSLRTQLAAVQANNVLKLGPFILFNPLEEIGVRGPNITFRGANIHIESGSGRTDDNGNCIGLGNLIIGYDEDPATAPAGLQLPVVEGYRAGSHNLVLGRFNQFSKTAFGGLVAGETNIISNAVATVTGGNLNAATGPDAAVTGGQGNTASAWGASVSGGSANTASGQFASVSGGFINTASGSYASVSGGELNMSSAGASSVLGGIQNTANFGGSVVIGGHLVTTVTNNIGALIAPQPPFP